MTVSEVIEMYKGDYTQVEIYIGLYGNSTSFHTDKISAYEPSSGCGNCEAGKENTLNCAILSDTALSYACMDIEDYNNSVLANCGITASDFGYTSEDKILCILVASREDK